MMLPSRFCRPVLVKAIRCLQQRDFHEQFKMVGTLTKFYKKDKKKKWHNTPTITHMLPGQPAPRSGAVTEGKRRRAIQVSKVLYDYITSIINSGELAPELADLRVDIVKVQLVPDFSSINVYWMVSGTKEDDMIEDLLKIKEKKLRQILISYRILGNIPPVNFVKDKTAARVLAIDKLFATIDFGTDLDESTTCEDHTVMPEESSTIDLKDRFGKLALDYDLEKTFNNVHVLDENGNLKLCSEENVNNEKLENWDFRHDLYGLNHDNIMNKLNIKKHKTKHRNRTDGDDIDSFTKQLKESQSGNVPVLTPKIKRKIGRLSNKENFYTSVNYLRNKLE